MVTTKGDRSEGHMAAFIKGNSLVVYIAETCKRTSASDEIYTNLESDLIGDQACQLRLKSLSGRPSETSND